tara:strand:- start:475 stop:1983 length:1509 start_codon:yes stop_codon:yes gene_type:complete
MKNNIENFALLIIFFLLIFLSYYQSLNQSFGYIIDQDWTILYNSLLIVSGFEQEYIDHPAYTTFVIYGSILKIFNFFFNLNLDVLKILDDENPGENLQKIFTIIRVSNSIIVFLIFYLLFKTIGLFNLSKIYSILILISFLFFDSIFQLLFILRSEALSLLFFLISNYFLLLLYKNDFSKKFIFLSSLFFTLSLLTKTQAILLFLASPFLINFINLKPNLKKEITFEILIWRNLVYLFGFFVILCSIFLYSKYPAPTDIIFFIIYFFIYIFYIHLIEGLTFKKLQNILHFILIFALGIFSTFTFIIFLDVLSIIQFDYSIIPNNFSRPISHMSSFTGLYDTSKNNVAGILLKIINEIYFHKNVILIFGKNFLFIFLFFLIYQMIKNFSSLKIKFYYITILFYFIILSCVFSFFRDQPFYSIYFIPLTLIILTELTKFFSKSIFTLIILSFMILNFNAVKSRIFQNFEGDRNVINLCGYNESNWNMINSNLKQYNKFQDLLCR